MENRVNKEHVYVAAYILAKKMFETGLIDFKSFERLNRIMADKQNSKPITIS